MSQFLKNTRACGVDINRNSRNIVCRSNVSSKFNEFVDKRRQVDKKRIERIKEIGNTLDHIARSEVKASSEIVNEFMPFLANLKNFKPFQSTQDLVKPDAVDKE